MSDLTDFQRKVHDPLRAVYVATRAERDALAARVETLERRLCDAPLGGDGSHWDDCWRSHIDCAVARVETLTAESEAMDHVIAGYVVSEGELLKRVETLENAAEQALLLLGRDRFQDDPECKVVRAVLRAASEARPSGEETWG